MIWFNLFIASLVATTGMTMFSYLIAKKKHKQFKEPEILNLLLKRAFSLESNAKKSWAGWAVHYFTGIIFTLIFFILYRIDLLSISFTSSIIYGIGAGLIGILGWKLMLYIIKNPLKLALSSFFLQLFFAHLVFSLCQVAMLELMGFK